jgi:endoglucanase
MPLTRSKKVYHFVLFACALFLSIIVKAQLPNAQQLAGRMKVGWNLGNTLEVVWGDPGTTNQTVIDSVKAAGFNTIRLPVAWFYHSDTITSVIDQTWLAKVGEVVNYCIKDSMYVIMNAHWDKGWLENRVNLANRDIVNKRQKAYWTQIASYFKDYDEHLLFAGSNEPNVNDTAEMSVLLSYHQTFIDAVRATGCNNSSRTLIIQGPSTDIDKTNTLLNKMPTDLIADRLIVEVHYYTPYQFCLMSENANWGNMFYYWGANNHSSADVAHNATWGEESDVEKYFGLMKTRFIDKGIPVILGEFAAMKRTNLTGEDLALHIASRQYYYKYVVKSAISKGIIPYCWDTGYLGLFDFSSGEITDPDIVKAIMQGAGEATDTYFP